MQGELTLLVDGHSLTDKCINAIINNIIGNKYIYLSRDSDKGRERLVNLTSELGKVSVYSVNTKPSANVQAVISANIAYSLGVFCETFVSTKFIIVSSDPALRSLSQSASQPYYMMGMLDLKEGSEELNFLKYLVALPGNEANLNTLLSHYTSETLSQLIVNMRLADFIEEVVCKDGKSGIRWDPEHINHFLSDIT